MTSPSLPSSRFRGPGGPRASRRVAAVLTSATLCAAPALLWTQPAGAAVSAAVNPAAETTPTVSVDDGFLSFTLPVADLEQQVGAVSSLVIEGDFAPGGNVAEQGVSKSGDNYTSLIGPLPPGQYRYRLRGDDLKIAADLGNPNVVTSDPTWRTVVVPGTGAEMIVDAPAGKGGRLKTVAYPGGTANVWTPPGYDAQRAQPYPVLYLLSETSGGAADWAQLGRAKQVLDNLVLAGKAEPMVVAMASTGADGVSALTKAIRGRYRVSSTPDGQAIAGAGSGASQALTLALTRPGTFGYVGSFSGQYTLGSVNAREVNAATKLLRLYTGNVTDAAYNPTYRLLRQLDAAGVKREFDGVDAAHGGNWQAWAGDLGDFVPRLFHPVTDHGMSLGHLPLRREFSTPPSGTTPSPWQYKDDNGNGFLTVETGTQYPDAKHVTLWGNWAPGGAWVNLPMVKVGDRWRATVGPLKPWLYYYKFLVDLQSVKDDANPSKVTTEPSWSTVLVTGGRSRLLADVQGMGGKVSTLTYDSKVAGEKRSAYVWTPPGYDAKRATPYPVLYLQHGGGQNYTDWLEMGRAKQILDNLTRDGAIVPMVVVMGNGNVSDFTPELRENLAPAARAAYNIASDPAHQALAGLSMGGFQTYWLLRDHPGEFAWIGTFSSALGFPGQPIDGAGYDAAAINAGTKLLAVYMGNRTDFVHPFAVATMQAFDKIGVHYVFPGETQGPHGWDAWQKNLIDFLPRLFK